MKQSLFLPSELDFTLLKFHNTTTNIDFEVCSCQISSCCPLCQTISFKIHSRYARTIGDLPVSGKLAKLKLQVRKFFCENSDCARKIFTERFKEQLSAYSRRFERLNNLISSMGLELGGNVAHRIGKLCYVKISASTILRLVLKCPIPIIQLPKIIGVDDWAFKKRLKYGTIIVDLEKNEVIDLLPDREGETLTDWLKQYPSIETVSRDRSSTYASATTEADEKIVQIADRWHILKNLTEGFEGFLNTQRESLRDISAELSEEQQLVLESIVPEIIEIAKKDIIITGRYHDNFLKVKELQREGVSKRKIAKMLKMSRHTIDRYWNRTSFLQKVSHQKSNLLDFEDYLIKRWQEGEQKVKVLFEEIKEQGFKHSIKLVYDFVKKYPKTIVEILPEAAKVKYYSSKQLSIWLSTFRKDWSEELPRAYLAKLLEDNPIIKKVRNTVLNFRRLMKEKEGDKLAAWCNEVINDENENIKGFARGILRDFQAVYQGFVSNWSNGPVEGQVNRLKNIKRQMYGRASFELLRKRVVVTSKR
ncbi:MULTISPECIES: ISL3 family transposase [unclassified Arcicella]|uniref:ISL3 family transposase n=1 Tax=unclassified Arcicella TaxID=2644986 RepID=UPI00286B4FB1|nr:MULTISPECIES: ISL3 family transposase [unclassified Arcicella]